LSLHLSQHFLIQVHCCVIHGDSAVVCIAESLLGVEALFIQVVNVDCGQKLVRIYMVRGLEQALVLDPLKELVIVLHWSLRIKAM
jgi:hypothetical protein